MVTIANFTGAKDDHFDKYACTQVYMVLKTSYKITFLLSFNT